MGLSDRSDGDANAKRALFSRRLCHFPAIAGWERGIGVMPSSMAVLVPRYRLTGGHNTNPVGILKLDNKVKGALDISLRTKRN